MNCYFLTLPEITFKLCSFSAAFHADIGRLSLGAVFIWKPKALHNTLPFPEAAHGCPFQPAVHGPGQRYGLPKGRWVICGLSKAASVPDGQLFLCNKRSAVRIMQIPTGSKKNNGPHLRYWQRSASCALIFQPGKTA